MNLTKPSDFYIFDYVFTVKTTNAAARGLNYVEYYGVPQNNENWLKETTQVNVSIDKLVDYLRMGQWFELVNPTRDAALIDQFIEYHLTSLGYLDDGYNKAVLPLEDIEDLKAIQEQCRVADVQINQRHTKPTGNALLDLIDSRYLSRDLIAKVEAKEKKSLSGAMSSKSNMRDERNRVARRGDSRGLNRYTGGRDLNGR